MRFTLLANIHPSLRKVGIKTTVTKPSELPGRIDMLVSIPLKKRLFVLEWKSLQIDYIDVGSGSPLERASDLAVIRNAGEVLDLRFRNDKFRAGQTIREWIMSGPQDQLHGYTQSAEIQKWKDEDYTITLVLVVVVGSRYVLLWNLTGKKLDNSPRLAVV